LSGRTLPPRIAGGLDQVARSWIAAHVLREKRVAAEVRIGGVESAWVEGNNRLQPQIRRAHNHMLGAWPNHLQIDRPPSGRDGTRGPGARGSTANAKRCGLGIR